MIVRFFEGAGEEQVDGRTGRAGCAIGQALTSRRGAVAHVGTGCCPNGHAFVSSLVRAGGGSLTQDTSSEAIMHTHDHSYECDSGLRPKSSRLDEPDSMLAMKAALSGRLDVGGSAGLVGLQRAAGNAGTAALVEEERSPVHDVVSSGGAPLEPGLRVDMEGRFGQDFGDVRIHNDGAAHDSAKSVNAQAYTVGSDIVFQRDKYDPGSDAGRHMLAHELTHVVQQRNGPVDGTQVGGGIKLSDPSDRFEREAVAHADNVMASPPAAPAAPAASYGVQRLTADESVVQRQEQPAEEEEETAQTYVQRDQDESEEESA
jgi:hypothetical protein